MKNATKRYHELDWIRVLAFSLLLFYHVGMVFAGWDFHIMNEQSLPVLKYVMVLINQWRLPLLFVISGAGTAFALRRRSLLQFTGERTRRLLLPVIVGCFFIVPPQIYVEYLHKGTTDLSYVAFQMTVFDMVPYPMGGAFSWHHLWFVVYLFVFCLISLPLLAFIRSQTGADLLERARFWLARSPLHMAAPVVPLVFLNLITRHAWPTTNGLIDDWANFSSSLLLFWLGFLMIGAEPVRQGAERHRRTFLIAALVCFGLEQLMMAQLDRGTMRYAAWYTLSPAYAWSAILTILGYARHYLQHTNRFLRYANEAVYPYYILHQSVMMVIVYLVVPLDLNSWLKLLLVLSGMSVGTGLIYEFGIRRFNLIRPLFGLNPKKIAQPYSARETTCSTRATGERRGVVT